MTVTIEEAKLTRSVTLLRTQQPYVVVYNKEKDELCKTEVAKEGNGYVNKFFEKFEIEIGPRNMDDLQVVDPKLSEEVKKEIEEEEKKAEDDLTQSMAKRKLHKQRYTVDSLLIFKINHDDIIMGALQIGFAPVKISALLPNSECAKKEVMDWFSVFYNNERVGHLKLMS